MNRRARVGVLISGRGSNLGALVAATAQADYPAEIVVVISNRADAAGLDLARAAGIATRVIAHTTFGQDRAAHETEIGRALEDSGVELVCLAGYMRRLTPLLVERWAGRMINIHPSLLPSFPGLHTHARALQAGVKVHGCTVHLVTAGVDEGPILGQAVVVVDPLDDEAALSARVLAQEHMLYPLVLRKLADPAFSPAHGTAETLVVL